MTRHPNKLVEQSEALNDFFESLMRDVDAYRATHDTIEPPAPKIVSVEASAQVAPLAPPRPTPKPVTQVAPALNLFEALPPVAPVDEAVPFEAEPELRTGPDTQAVIESAPESIIEEQPQAAPEPPVWQQQAFQAMLFKVAGLTLAVPLIDLSGVLECEPDRVTRMPGHADFYLGLLPHLGKNIPLVDTARLVLPGDKLAGLSQDDPNKRITRAVLINNNQYALGCDAVNEVITLQPNEVRWRSQRTQRRWLAGTVIEHMCALIDAPAFAELLASRMPVEAFRG